MSFGFPNSQRFGFTALARSTGAGGFFPANQMQLGMGLGGITSFNGYYPFANVAWNCNPWIRQTGSGAFTQEFGTLTAAVPTDTFYAKFAEGTNVAAALPAGTYTVLNPDGCEIGIGNFADNIVAFTTATSFTFTMPGGSAVVSLVARGSVTNINGPIQIIMPGRLSAFQAGDYWNPQFITFLSGLNVNCLRFMDWQRTYDDLTEEWSEVPTGLPIMLTGKATKQAQKVTFQLIVDLCNRLSINPWINTPVRAQASYHNGLAAYLRDNLDPALKVYLEYGNEVGWNFGANYRDQGAWVEFLDFTPYVASSNVGISGWTYTAHGMSTGDMVRAFWNKDNYTFSDNPVVFPNGWGVRLYVEVTDANNFKLYEDVGRTILVPSTANSPKLTYKRENEAGKVANVNTNFGEASLEMWQRFDAIMGRGRCLHVLATQGVNGSITTNRLAPSGVAAATDMIAPAAYYSGDWFIGMVDTASGQFTPKVWSRRAGDVVRVAVYASGSTPTIEDVGTATGAGYIGHRDMTIVTLDSTSYVSGSAITGLTNGTNYEVYVLMTSATNGFKWLANATVAATASVSTVTISDGHAAMAARARYNINTEQSGIITTQQAVAGGKPVVFYECGSDYFGPGPNIPAELKAWRDGYTQSAEAGNVFGHFYQTMAANGMKLANQFVDINATLGVFNIAESFTDTSDERYLKFVGYGGAITPSTKFDIANVVASNILVEPSYPAVVYTFPDATKTYSIFNGNRNSNYAIVGNELRIVNGYDINWGVPTVNTLVIEASNGVLSDYFNITFATGFSWYEADAKFAWSSITDTDNAAINPIIGGTLARTSGSGATIAGGLWDMDGNVYSSGSGATSGLNAANPFLLAAVIDKDNSGVADTMWQATGGMFFEGNFQFRYNNVSNYQRNFLAAGGFAAGKHVYWAYHDGAGTVTCGYDQIENPTTLTIPGGVNTTRMRVGGAADASPTSEAKHGSMQIVERTGMTLADAKAIVQKMQTLHGI